MVHVYKRIFQVKLHQEVVVYTVNMVYKSCSSPKANVGYIKGCNICYYHILYDSI